MGYFLYLPAELLVAEAAQVLVPCEVAALKFAEPRRGPTHLSFGRTEVTADEKTLVAQNNTGQKEIWRHIEEPGDKEVRDKGEAQP